LRDLRAIFDQRGVASVTVDLPSSRPGAGPVTGLREDADAVIRAAASISGPIILVGHSYGGAVVVEAAPGIDQLDQLIFIAALVPLAGQSATDVSREVRVRTRLDQSMIVEGDHLRLDPELAAQALYNDCDADTAAWASSQLTTQTIASFRSPRSSEDLETPSLFIRCDEDFAVDPSLQDLMASRCSESTSISSDHSPFLSHPLELFEALMK
jgi:pimeloyl-ACP methyl ester carboxylesterase